MKKIVILLATLLPLSAFAAPKSGDTLTEAQAVLNDSEIQNILAVIKTSRNLDCQPMTAEDVVINKGSGDAGDTFAVDYVCNDKDQGANVQTIEFNGTVVMDQVTAPIVDMTSVTIEEGE